MNNVMLGYGICFRMQTVSDRIEPSIDDYPKDVIAARAGCGTRRQVSLP